MLRWENVDLVRAEIALTTRKTNRRILIPIAAPLLDYLLKIPASDDPKAFVFPRAAARLVRCREEHGGGLSNQFHDILASAGLVQRRSHQKAKDGRGRAARRRSSEVSFHSLRHTATSLLKNAGVPQSVVMDIIGHESRAVSQVYTHVGEAEKRQAMAAFPSLSTLLQAAKKKAMKEDNMKNRFSQDPPLADLDWYKSLPVKNRSKNRMTQDDLRNAIALIEHLSRCHRAALEVPGISSALTKRPFTSAFDGEIYFAGPSP